MNSDMLIFRGMFKHKLFSNGISTLSERRNRILIGHIALCPHFHQPHFQLHKIREKVFNNSYAAWFDLLEEAVMQSGFFINIHFSGSFIYWLRDQKPNTKGRFKHLIKTGKIGIIGGFADEAFAQLSSRKDDIYFQIKEYNNLCQDFLGVKASEWQGIHITERECGEFLLNEVSRVANLIGAVPLYYLDAETFFEPHFSELGGSADYCLRHFGFNDPVSKTTFPHLPKQMLYFGLRDEIAGTAFYCLPIHSEHRYRLLKNNSFAEGDDIRISPEEYFSQIKHELEQAWKLALCYGKKIEPIVVIFEDAEKFGHWSGNPAGDRIWLIEFFKLVENDPNINFTLLKNYFESQRFLDTYPARTSLSYPEWDNWTAKRGIRGVVFGDERLRRTISRLRSFEQKQNEFETKMLNMLDISEHTSIIRRAVWESSERFILIERLLSQKFGGDLLEQYRLVNRIRNILYQEDPKWASRHPNYGAAPYFDSTGLAYLEIAERLLNKLVNMVNEQSYNTTVDIIDWDFDGDDEVMIKAPLQTLSVDMQGGCIDYHFALEKKLSDVDYCFTLLRENIKTIPSYHSIFKHTAPLVLTETDSRLKRNIDGIGSRKEQCRNSFRCDLYYFDNDEFIRIGNLGDSLFVLSKIEQDVNCIRVVCNTSLPIEFPNGRESLFSVQKEFVVTKDGLDVNITSSFDKDIGENIFLVPQIVTSLTPSDEVTFEPVSQIVLQNGNINITYLANDMIESKQGVTSYLDIEKKTKWSGNLTYYYKIRTGSNDVFINAVHCCLSSSELIPYIRFEPAIKNYYEGLVGESQSRLGYKSSGVMIMPFVEFKDKRTKFSAKLTWQFDQSIPTTSEIINLITPL